MRSTRENLDTLSRAVDRLLRGESVVSDGRLTLASLVAEAGLPRAYLYRAPYTAERERFVREAETLTQGAKEPDRRQADRARFKGQLADAERRAAKYFKALHQADEQLKKASSQIIYLHQQNGALRASLEQTQAALADERGVARLPRRD